MELINSAVLNARKYVDGNSDILISLSIIENNAQLAVNLDIERIFKLTNGQISAAPNGDLLVIGQDIATNNLVFYKITDGTQIDQWVNKSNPASIIVEAIFWQYFNSSSNQALKPCLSVSDFIGDEYVIDIYYWVVSGSSYEINQARSFDSGKTWNSLNYVNNISGIPYPTADNIFMASSKPFLLDNGNIHSEVFWIGEGFGFSGSYAVYYAFLEVPLNSTGYFFTVVNGWNGQVDTYDWVLHSLDVFYKNGIRYIVFSGYHNIIENTNGQFSLYETKLLRETGNHTTDIWSSAEEIQISLSSSSKNLSSYLYPTLNYDGEFLWLIFKGNTIYQINELGTITLSTDFYMAQSKDFENFSYPTPIYDTGGNQFVDNGLYAGAYYFAYQNNYYYLAGNNQIWQFSKNNIIADIGNDILNYRINDISNAPSTLSFDLGNQSDQWYGVNATKSNNQALKKDNKIYLYQGYYNSNQEPEVVPKDIFYIDDIKQDLSANKNNLTISGRNFYKNLKITVSKFTYNFKGCYFYNDDFSNSTMSNWNQVKGSWTEKSIAVFSGVDQINLGSLQLANDNLSNYENIILLNTVNIHKKEYSVAFNASLFNPVGTVDTVNSTFFDIFLVYINNQNYLKLNIVQKSVSSPGYYYVYLIQVIDGNAITLASTQSPAGGWLGGWENNYPFYPFFIRFYNYQYFDIGVGNNVDSFTPKQFFNISWIFQKVNWQLSAVPGHYSFGFGSNLYNANICDFSFCQYNRSQNIEELIKKLSAKAKIYDFSFEKNFEDNLFTLDNFNIVGPYENTNRELILSGQGTEETAAFYNQPLVDGEITFDCKFNPKDPTMISKFNFFFRNNSNSQLNQYYLWTLSWQNNASVNSAFSIYNTGSAQLQTGLFQLSTTGLKDIHWDLSQWHKYKIVFNKNWMFCFIDNQMVDAFFDSTLGQTAGAGYANMILSNDGYWGFLSNSDGNSSIKIKNISSTCFWSQINSLSVNPGDDIENSILTVADTAKAFLFSDLLGRLKTIVLSANDLPNYSYGDVASNYQLLKINQTQSDKEYVNQVTIIGLGVSAVARQTQTLGQNAKIREEVIVDYKITTVADAQKRAEYELVNFNKFNVQPEITQFNNVGSELYDVITVKDTSNPNAAGVDGNFRVYNQQITNSGENNEYYIDIQTGSLQ